MIELAQLNPTRNTRFCVFPVVQQMQLHSRFNRLGQYRLHGLLSVLIEISPNNYGKWKNLIIVCDWRKDEQQGKCGAFDF